MHSCHGLKNSKAKDNLHDDAEMMMTMMKIMTMMMMMLK